MSAAKPPQRSPNRRQLRQLAPGASLLSLATLVAAATLGLTYPAGNAVFCERLAPLGVLGVLAAVLIALCFRQISATAARRLLWPALLMAAASLFVSARFIAKYQGPCRVVEQQLQQQKAAH